MRAPVRNPSIFSLRRAGVCLHPTSLPGPHGIGELGRAARDFVDLLAAMQIGVWQMLPTGPTGYGDSPYQPSSVFAGNELLLDLDELTDLDLLEARQIRALTRLPSRRVDYGRLVPLKWELLDAAAARFADSADATLRAGFEEFVEAEEDLWLRDYACFRVLKRAHAGRSWQDWPRRFRRRYRQSLAKLLRDEAPALDRIRILQYLFDRQWRGLRHYASERGVQLFGDVPIFVAADSADAWSRRNLVQVDADGSLPVVAGVPPDYFDDDGQRWGNPLYRWQRHEKTGFAWWIARLQRGLARNDMLRLDHFRGFAACWTIPASARTARRGQWIASPGRALFDAARERLGELPLVAEDLGVITPDVVALRRHIGVPGMHVLQFSLDEPGFDPQAIPTDCVCYTATHDNDTTRGWFRDRCATRKGTEARRLRARVLGATGGHASSVHHDLFRLACRSDARIAIAPMQDLVGLGSAARLNRPGTRHGNWQWRLAPQDLSETALDSVAAIVRESGRA